MEKLKRVLREETTVNNETGKVLKRETTMVFSKEPAYVKLYFDCLGVYIKNDGLTSSLNDMLVEILKRSTYAEEGQMVYLNSFTKEQVCKATGKGMERMKQAIRIWVDNKILLRVARGVYQVNPFIFGKGEWRNIANLRATFDFSSGAVNVEREYEQEPELKTKKRTKKIVQETQLTQFTQCPECGEGSLELVEKGDLAGQYVCPACGAIIEPKDVKFA